MSRFRAAAGAVELQPIVGARLTGFGARLERSVGIHDPLMVKLLLLDDGAQRLLWVSCDLIGLDPEDDAQLRRRVAIRLSIPPENVFVSCTHTHSGPGSMRFRGPLASVDDAWLARAFQRVVDEAARLPARLKDARLAHTLETVTDLGYNRQDAACPIDERLLVARFIDEHDQPIATILNYATHPVVLGQRNLQFTGDYPGYATRFVEQDRGGIALFIQGSAGDVDPVVYRDLGRDAGTFEIAREMGQTLAMSATRAVSGIKPQADLSILATHARVDLPLEAPPSKEDLSLLREDLIARRGPADVIPDAPDARWAMFQLAWVEQLERAIARSAVPRALPVQLFAARIGDVCIVTFPLEIYSQIGLDVRRALAPRPVIIAAYTNGLFGYAPTDRAIAQGGYGPALSHRFFPHVLTPLARGTEAALVRAATALIRKVA